jgi:kynureninase
VSSGERARAEALDRADPLAPFRARFAADPEGGRIYLDGNSLGRPSRAALAALEAVAADWQRRLVRGWPDWIERPLAVGDLLAEGVLGARPGEVLVADSTTVNLYKLAAAALDLRPAARAVVLDPGDFPTDRYVLAGLAERRALELRPLERDPVEGPTRADVEQALAGGGVGLVCLSHVDYRSGAVADLEAIAQAAHAAGALVLFDLSHAAGAVRVELERSGADLAVGCTYKHLGAGPGAPAFLYARSELQPALRNPIQGWFGQRDQFAMPGSGS